MQSYVPSPPSNWQCLIWNSQINVPVGQFKMKRGMFAKEFRQPELTLERADVSDGTNVFVTRGIPLRLGEILCSFFTYEFEKGTFAPLVEMPVDENVLLADLKKILADKIGTDSKLIRIRGAPLFASVSLLCFIFLSPY